MEGASADPKLELLRRVPLFAGLEPDALAAVNRAVSADPYAATWARLRCAAAILEIASGTGDPASLPLS